MHGLARAVLMGSLAATIAQPMPKSGPDRELVARIEQLTRATTWTRVATIPLGFQTFHPQGMVKIGDAFYVSSVDRTRMAGHLFKMDATGKLLADLPLGDAAMYHPGGIDFDGRDIWVPVAEYRPDS